MCIYSLQENSINDAGIEEIGRGIAKNRSLCLLALQFNSIGNNGVLALGKSLRTNTVLKTLYIYGNRISEAGLAEGVYHMSWTEDKQIMFDMDY